MNSEPAPESAAADLPRPPARQAPPPVAAEAAPFVPPRALWLFLLLVAAAALIGNVLLWQKLASIQELLARQSADAGTQAAEARGLAKQAQDLARETAARQAVAEARLSEVALQRSQLEELMQSLSRSRDENLVVDIESAVRLAQQQAQLTGSLEPLLAALRTADQRVARAAQPRLAPVQRALARDMERLKAATVADIPGLLSKLDDLVRQADELPLANAVGPAAAAASGRRPAEPPAGPSWWEQAAAVLQQEVAALVRVSRIEQPEAALLSPEQSFFVRENLKLKLVNARLGLLARQTVSARADVAAAATLLGRYFDPAARKTQLAAGLMQQVQGQMRNAELPRVDDTLAALATAAAGR